MNKKDKSVSKLNTYLTRTEKQKLDLVSKLTKPQLKELLESKAKENPSPVNTWDEEEWHAKIAIVSDTHINNKQCKIDELHEFYNKAEVENVDAIVHAWDLTEWINVYKWQVYELLNVSFEDQLKYVIDNYPKAKGKQTYFIQGNHDEAWLKQAWADFWKAVSKERKDMVNMWFYNNKININWINVELQHGWGWSPYAVSYHLQKYMERMWRLDETDIFILWHYHRALLMEYRDMIAMLPWAFLGESLLAKRFKLWNNIMGWIIDIEKKKDWEMIVKPELIKY